MIRSLIAAVLTSTALLASAGASAQTPAGYFVAVPAAPATKDAVMTRDTPWSLRDGAYITAKAPVRDMVACQLIARGVGEISSFSAGGKAFDAAALGECNTKAKGGHVAVAKADPAPTPAN
jgi:hypothetical protein